MVDQLLAILVELDARGMHGPASLISQALEELGVSAPAPEDDAAPEVTVLADQQRSARSS